MTDTELKLPLTLSPSIHVGHSNIVDADNHVIAMQVQDHDAAQIVAACNGVNDPFKGLLPIICSRPKAKAIDSDDWRQGWADGIEDAEKEIKRFIEALRK